MSRHYNKKHMQPIRRKLRREMTYTEKVVWSVLRRKQLGVRFLRQYSVDNYVIDFYSPEIKLALEIDGEVHDEVDVKINDAVREQHIESFGITILRLTNEEIEGNPNKAFQKVEKKIDELKNKH